MLESQPNTNMTFPPSASIPYRVKTGDSWDSVAQAHKLTAWQLIEFNFPVIKNTANFQLKCREVNWLLRTHVGCTKSSDGKNYRFDATYNPGRVYLPTKTPSITYSHRVRLHFRSLSLTNIRFETLLSRAKQVFAPHGIRIDYASGESLALSEAETDRFKKVDGACNWTITSGEFNDLLQLGSPAPTTDIIVFFVASFGKVGRLGCGGHRILRPACIVAAAGSHWDTAHEIGHVILGSRFTPVHHASTNNLMYEYSGSRGSGNLPTLTAAQVAQMKSSVCSRAI